MMRNAKNLSILIKGISIEIIFTGESIVHNGRRQVKALKSLHNSHTKNTLAAIREKETKEREVGGGARNGTLFLFCYTWIHICIKLEYLGVLYVYEDEKQQLKEPFSRSIIRSFSKCVGIYDLEK